MPDTLETFKPLPEIDFREGPSITCSRPSDAFCPIFRNLRRGGRVEIAFHCVVHFVPNSCYPWL